MRNGLSILRHWILVALAYTFSIWSMIKGIWSKIANFTIKTVGDIAQVIRSVVQVKSRRLNDNVFSRFLQLKSAI